jgi:nitrogen-specific signal transduction histidine kinase
VEGCAGPSSDSRARNETEGKLTAVRKPIFEERGDITLLQEKLVQRKEEYEKAIVDKAERVTNLETRLNDLID